MLYCIIIQLCNERQLYEFVHNVSTIIVKRKKVKSILFDGIQCQNFKEWSLNLFLLQLNIMLQISKVYRYCVQYNKQVNFVDYSTRQDTMKGVQNKTNIIPFEFNTIKCNSSKLQTLSMYVLNIIFKEKNSLNATRCFNQVISILPEY